MQSLLLSIILADLAENRNLLGPQVQKVTVCDLCLVDFDPFWVFLCFKVRCLLLAAAKNIIVSLLAFWFQSLCFIEKRSNLIGSPWLFCLQSPLSLLLILTWDPWSKESEGNRISLSFLSLLPITPCPPFSCASCFPFPMWVGTKRDDCGNKSELVTNLFYLYPQCDKRTLTVD